MAQKERKRIYAFWSATGELLGRYVAVNRAAAVVELLRDQNFESWQDLLNEYGAIQENR